MKRSYTLALLSTAIPAALLLASCGGGNVGDAGSSTAFNVQPTAVTLTGPNANTCGTGDAGRVYVLGGAGPYTVLNTEPTAILVSKTALARPGDFFDVQLLGCMTTIPVVVVDATGKQATVTFSSVKGTT